MRLKWYETILMLIVAVLAVASVVEVFRHDETVAPYGSMAAGLSGLFLALVFARRKRETDRERRKRESSQGK